MLIELYIAITMMLFGIATILLLREFKKNDFRVSPFSGTYAAYLYYKELKKTDKKITKTFWFYILANLNFLVCAIVFLISAFS
jgi:hypothetical protein